MNEAKCEIHRRFAGEMAELPFARNYIVLKSVDEPVTYWVKIKSIRCLRERCVGQDHAGKNKVEVLFKADYFNYRIINVDIIQFLAECYLGEIIDESH